MIKEIIDNCELEESVNVIRTAFLTVAEDFNLTPENCPTNPAFITLERLLQVKRKGAKFFGLYDEERQVGFVAVEEGGDVLYYMERLAILPEYRHRGHGRRILDFVDDYVRRQGGQKISIGIINDNIILKNWYQRYGYIQTDVRQFKHLPFAVCFLEKQLVSS